MSLQTVLTIVVDNSVLDLSMINGTIRSLSREFRDVGTRAMEEHAQVRQGLDAVNSDFRFHYCTLCDKPHVMDGSWPQSDLCDCRLDSSVQGHTREIQRRARLATMGDPRMDPSFALLSSKSKTICLAHFVKQFSELMVEYVCGKGWLYRMSAFPLLQIGQALDMSLYNRTACGLLNTCIYIDLLRKEFCCDNRSEHPTRLLDIGLEVMAAARDQTELDRYNALLSDDAACLEKFLGGDRALTKSMISAIFDSYVEIVTLGTPDGATIMDNLKNLGNSIGIFLSDDSVRVFLTDQMIHTMFASLPETFVWMPVYGGRREDYFPPVNQFAHLAAARNHEGDAALENQPEE